MSEAIGSLAAGVADGGMIGGNSRDHLQSSVLIAVYVSKMKAISAPWEGLFAVLGAN
jgi:hypothetical protein